MEIGGFVLVEMVEIEEVEKRLGVFLVEEGVRGAVEGRVGETPVAV